MKNTKWIQYAKAMVTALCVGLLTLGALTSVVSAELDHAYCVYDQNGVCTRGGESHYEPPAYVRMGGTVDVTVENEGQWNALAKVIAGEELAYDQNGRVIDPREDEFYVQLAEDLDFSSMEFIPLGTETQPFCGTLIDLRKDHTVSGIRYHRDGAYAGLVAYAHGLRLEGIALTDSSFSGSSAVGALVGYGVDVTVSHAYVRQVTVSASDGTAGAFMGQAGLREDGSGESEIAFASLAIEVTDGQGRDLAFASGDHVTVRDSFCLYATDGEGGRTSRETFASGAVAYRLQKLAPGWSQIVDALVSDEISGTDQPLEPDPFPVYVPRSSTAQSYRVYAVSYCDGSTATYTNNAKRDYTVHKVKSVLEWIWDVDYCEAKILCELCGEEDITVAHVETDYSYVPVRGDYIATITGPDGSPLTDSQGNIFTDTNTVIGIPIESMIGMESMEKVFDNMDVHPEDLMNNHRLNDGNPAPAYKEYEVFFVDPKTGERLVEIYYDYYGQKAERARSVSDAGVYDLLVVGKNDYVGQSYTFQSALTISPAVVEIRPLDVYKYDDGTAHFAADYEFADETLAEYFSELVTVTFGAASASSAGEYEIKVTLKSKADGKNVRFTLTRDSVQALILPRLYATVENKSYPTEFTYGESIPTPAASHFTFTEGGRLSFTWYRAELDAWVFDDNGKWVEGFEILSLQQIEGKPRDAGDYILRVKVEHDGELAASYCDVRVTVNRAGTLDIELDTAGLSVFNNGYDDYIVVRPGEQIPYTVKGLLAGDTMESANIHVDISVYPAEGNSSLPTFTGEFPDRPHNVNYRVSYMAYSVDEFGNEGNYERIHRSVNVTVRADGYATPTDGSFLYDGEAQSIDVILSWTPVSDADSYRLLVTSPDGEQTEIIRTVGDNLYNDIRYGNLFAMYTLTQAGEYTVEVFTGGERTERFTFTVEICTEYGELVDEILDLGRHTVTVTENGKASESVVSVSREIVMLVKECEYELNSGIVTFDPKKIVMEAGKVIMLGHTLVDVTIAVDEEDGTIRVTGFRVVDADGKDVSHLYRLNSYARGGHGNEDGRNVAHIFDASCDSDCNVYGCEYVRVRTHSGGMATCTEEAVCQYCHAPYGGYSKTNHTDSATHIAPNGEDMSTHLRIHDCCGQIAEILPHTETRAATCLERAFCGDCGWAYGELDPLNHASPECAYESLGEQGHRVTHLCCNATETAEHGGGEATCTDAAVCVHCDASYGELDPQNHAKEIVYTPHTADPSVHTEEYPCCQRSATVAHSGGEETCISRGVCDLCKAEYGKINPHNHATDELVYTVRGDNASLHDMTRACCGEFVGKAFHTGGEGTCVAGAACEHCGAEYGGDMNADNHASDQFIYVVDPADPTHHVKTHACCGVEVDRSAHRGGQPSCEHGALCEDCGYDYAGDTVDHTYANDCTSLCAVCDRHTRAVSFHKDGNRDGLCDLCGAEVSGQGLSGGAVSAVVTASVLLVGGCAFAVVWFLIKKKSWDELGHLLVG